MERTFNIDSAALTLTETDRIGPDYPTKVIVDATLTLADGSTHDCGPFSIVEWADRELLTEAFRTVLFFFGAASEAYTYDSRGAGHGGYGYVSDNYDLFAPAVMEWAFNNAEEIELLSLDSEEMAV